MSPSPSTTGLSGVDQRPSRGTTGLPEALQDCQGHHRPLRGTLGLSGAPSCLLPTLQACQGHHVPVLRHFIFVRGTTDLAGPRGTNGLAGEPQSCQGHHLHRRDGTIGLAGAPWAFQGHHRPVVGISGLSGAPQSFQMHYKPVKGHLRPSRDTTGLLGLFCTISV